MILRRGLAARRGEAGPAATAYAATGYASAALPTGRTPWRQARYCALDFELTGLDERRDEIISFGAIPVDGPRISLRSVVSGLVRPARELSEPSILVHGIRAADLARAPLLDEAILPLLRALAGRVLIAHAASVETSFLRRALRERGLRLRGPVIDTEVLGCVWEWERSRRLLKHFSLGDLAAALGLPADRPHVAVGDALTTAQVFVALASHLDARHRETVNSLARAERRLHSLRLFHAG
jgi:DNA polymerase III subunit epsilon